MNKRLRDVYLTLNSTQFQHGVIHLVRNEKFSEKLTFHTSWYAHVRTKWITSMQFHLRLHLLDWHNIVTPAVSAGFDWSRLIPYLCINGTISICKGRGKRDFFLLLGCGRLREQRGGGGLKQGAFCHILGNIGKLFALG